MRRTTCFVEDGGSLLVGTGTEGKIFRLAGNPGARHAPRPRRRPADHGAPPRALRPHRRRHQQSREGVRAVVHAGAQGHVRVRRARCRNGRDLGRHPLASDRARRTGADRHAIRQHRDAGRDLERLVERLHHADGERIGSPNARYLQWRATFTSDSATGARADVGHGGVPAAQPPAGGDVDHRASAGSVFQRPFSTGELEIAGFEDNTSDGRPPNQSSAAPGAAAPPAPRSAAASIRRACRRSSGRRRTRTTTGCSTTSSTGAKAKPPGRC